MIYWITSAARTSPEDGIVRPSTGCEWSGAERAEGDCRARHGPPPLVGMLRREPVKGQAAAAAASSPGPSPETPVALRDRHRQLYAMLAAYFCQDPAAWEDARR
jgi:hypothetical protein